MIIDYPANANLEICEATWRLGQNTIGFIAIRNKYTLWWQAFVGVAQHQNPQTDALAIAEYGCLLSLEEAIPFFPALDPALYTTEELQ